MDQPRIGLGDLFQDFGGSILRVVIDHNHVEGKTGLLGQRTFDGIRDRPFTVLDGDHHARLDRKRFRGRDQGRIGEPRDTR